MQVFRSLFLIAFIGALLPVTAQGQSWCSRAARPGWEDHERISTSDPWFHVHRMESDIYAIYEPNNFQEIISWLILGTRRALLFDTGMGMSQISSVVVELTDLPVTVINSHTHFDHIGGNAEFNDILSTDTEYSRQSARGIPHADVAQEVAPDAFCGERLITPIDTAKFHVRPFNSTGTIRDGSIIDLGGRRIEVLRVPGHTPDAVSLLDRDRGFLWTGDTFYAGPIWLYFPGTDLDAYEESITRLAALAPSLTNVFPGHNTPMANPELLPSVRDAFKEVRAGAASFVEQDDELVEYQFTGFSFLMRRPAR